MIDYDKLKIREEAEAIFKLACDENKSEKKIVDLIENTLEHYLEIGYQSRRMDEY